MELGQRDQRLSPRRASPTGIIMSEARRAVVVSTIIDRSSADVAGSATGRSRRLGPWHLARRHTAVFRHNWVIAVHIVKPCP